MKKPLIGINPYHIKRKGSFWNATKEDYYLTVWNSGGCPVTLNYPKKEEHISNIVEHLHGLLMVGGPDLPADVYGSTNPELLDKDQMSKEREFFDREVFLETLKQGKKVLADLRIRCFAKKSTFDKDANVMAFNEGQRQVVLHIDGFLNFKKIRE